MLDELKMPIKALNEDAVTAASAFFCGRCGGETTVTRTSATPNAATASPCEPPRYCPECRRRMVVQVDPDGLDGALQPPRRDVECRPDAAMRVRR